MERINENNELIKSALSGGEYSNDDLKILKDSYIESRKVLLGDDVFSCNSFSEVYKCMRDADVSSSEYIKALESRIEYLNNLLNEFTSGVAYSNAEFVKNLIRNY